MAKKQTIPPAAAMIIAAALAGTGVNAGDNERRSYIGKKVYGRKDTDYGKIAGEITATSHCRLEGCSAVRLHVRWPDGHRTYPCAKGCDVRPDGNFQII